MTTPDFSNGTQLELAPGDVCAQCGTTLSSLFPTCLWCSSSGTPYKRASISNPDLLLQGGPLHGPRDTDLSLLNPLSASQAPTSKPLRRRASHQPTPRVSVDLRDESLMDAFTSSFPSLLKQEKGERQVKHIKVDRDGPTRLLGPMEGNNVAMLRPSILSTEAGSSSSTSPSAVHDPQSRSRSLFTLTLPSHSEGTPSTTSTTTSMINAAKAITRRLSSSAPLTVQPMPVHDLEGKKSLHDQDEDVFEGSGRTLHRKKRLQQAPVAVLPPLQTGSGLDKKVSRTSLSNRPPIAISLRPGTADSSTSTRRRPSPGGEEREASPKSATPPSPPASPPVAQEKRGVRWSTDDEQHATKCKSNGSPILKSGGEVSPPLSPSRSPTNSVTSSTPGVPRLGHPSRPYYSAIRKHCMSSPASSRPSVDHGLAPPLPAPTSRSRPTSTSVPPSAFTMPNLTPFTRRPVSIGVVPVSEPVTTPSRPNSAGNGMSVFDINDDALEEQEEPKRRMSSSLSRAFNRRNSQDSGKKRRMSGSIFSEGSPKDERRQSEAGEAAQAFSMGISMSGETEMRMALAAMQQQEEVSAAQQADRGSSVGHSQNPSDSSQSKYRFRQTMDLSGGSAGGADDEREGRQKKKAQDSTLKKLKRGLKGLLK